MSGDFVTSTCIGINGEFGGEFGNQLFQISAVLGYAHRYNCQALFRPWSCFHGERDYAAYFPSLNYRNDIRPRHIYIQRRIGYDEIPYQSGLDLRGSFQSEKYFFPIREAIRELFREPAAVESQITALLRAHDVTEFSALHMRFYDREVIDRTPLIHTLPEHYFAQAVIRLPVERKLVVVSNNRSRAQLFAQEHLQGREVIIFSNPEPLVDFYLLTRASDLVISNSTFSWWGAYLNRRGARIFAPPARKWYAFPNRLTSYWDAKDLFPAHFVEVPF